jgi:type IV secretory pathway component VirB8
MEFDDIFENKRKYHGGFGQSKYHEDNRYRNDLHPAYHRNDAHQKWLIFLLKYRTNRTIRIFTKIAALVVIATIILLVIVLFPLIMKVAYYISQNGLQGVVDSITVFLDKLWKGFGK